MTTGLLKMALRCDFTGISLAESRTAKGFIKAMGFEHHNQHVMNHENVVTELSSMAEAIDASGLNPQTAIEDAMHGRGDAALAKRWRNLSIMARLAW